VGIIRALADETSIDNTHRGTTVRVSFTLGQVQRKPVEGGQSGTPGLPMVRSDQLSIDLNYGTDPASLDLVASAEDQDDQVADLLLGPGPRALVGVSA
jgi:hypothetical protein